MPQYHAMKNMIPHLILFANILVTLMLQTTSGCSVTDEYEVHVISKLPVPPMLLHCASGDDDLGYWKTTIKYDFHWKFCESYLGNTLFFCHLWWNKKQAVFDVFKQKDQKKDQPCTSGKCFWEARPDGIYFAGGANPGSFKKMYGWNASNVLPY